MNASWKGIAEKALAAKEYFHSKSSLISLWKGLRLMIFCHFYFEKKLILKDPKTEEHAKKDP